MCGLQLVKDCVDYGFRHDDVKVIERLLGVFGFHGFGQFLVIGSFLARELPHAAGSQCAPIHLAFEVIDAVVVFVFNVVFDAEQHLLKGCVERFVVVLPNGFLHRFPHVAADLDVVGFHLLSPLK